MTTPSPYPMYPWTGLPPHVARILADAPLAEGAERAGRALAVQGDVLLAQLEALARWIRGGCRLVTVSEASCRVLASAAVRLPQPVVDPWRHGAFFALPLPGEDGRADALIYVEPLADRQGIRYCAEARGPGRLLGERVAGAPPNIGILLLHPVSPRAGFRLPIYDRQEALLAPRVPTLDPGDLATVAPWARHVAASALAAIQADPEISLNRRKVPEPRGGRRNPVHPRKLTLSDDGTRLLARRWQTEDQAGAHAEHAPHTPATLHSVRPHYAGVWVREPAPGEAVQATQERNGRTYHLVRRVRGRDGPYARGTTLRAAEAAMVAGFDDLQ